MRRKSKNLIMVYDKFGIMVEAVNTWVIVNGNLR